MRSMTDTSLQVFNSQEFGNIRVAVADNGNPIFCARDVATALGYKNPNDAISKHCKGIAFRYPLPTDGGEQMARFITEGDMYRLIASSKLESAQQFETWVFDTVLPSIRAHGMYATPQTVEQMLNDPDTMIATLKALKAERQRTQALIEDNARLLPKATMYDVAIEAEGTMTITEAARYLSQRDKSITRKRLFALLRADCLICKQDNAPTKTAINRGYMVQMMTTRQDGRANDPYARMTRKGLDYCLRNYCTTNIV
jgi:prophage antirepressor-like protein